MVDFNCLFVIKRCLMKYLPFSSCSWGDHALVTWGSSIPRCRHGENWGRSGGFTPRIGLGTLGGDQEHGGAAGLGDSDIPAQPREDSGDMGLKTRKSREKPPHEWRYLSFPA